MNDKIKEFAEQAGIPKIDGNWDYNDREVLKREDDEWIKALPSQIIHTLFQTEKSLARFAELIVRECLNNMENCDGDLDFAIWKTKKNFGVEE